MPLIGQEPFSLVREHVEVERLLEPSDFPFVPGLRPVDLTPDFLASAERNATLSSPNSSRASRQRLERRLGSNERSMRGENVLVADVVLLGRGMRAADLSDFAVGRQPVDK